MINKIIKPVVLEGTQSALLNDDYAAWTSPCGSYICVVASLSVIKLNWPSAGRRVHLARWHFHGPNFCTKKQLSAPPAVSGWIKDGAIIVRHVSDAMAGSVTATLPILQLRPGKQYGGSGEFWESHTASFWVFFYPRLGKERSKESNSHTRDAIMMSEMWTFQFCPAGTGWESSTCTTLLKDSADSRLLHTFPSINTSGGKQFTYKDLKVCSHAWSAKHCGF